MPQSIVKNAEPEELGTLPKNLQEWTSGFIELPGTKNVLSSSAFDPTGCFVAEDKGSIVGCVAVTNLPRKNWLVIRYLAAKLAQSRVYAVEKLLSRALQYVETKKPEFLRATTPSIQPYVDVYKSFAFKPIRRDFRITWDLTKTPESPTKQVEVREVTENSSRNRQGSCRIYPTILGLANRGTGRRRRRRPEIPRRNQKGRTMALRIRRKRSRWTDRTNPRLLQNWRRPVSGNICRSQTSKSRIRPNHDEPSLKLGEEIRPGQDDGVHLLVS